MKPNSTALAVSLLSSVLLLNAQAATAQTTSPPSATATRPATTPPGQTSMPNESPAGHYNSDHRRSQSRSRGEENERGRKAEGRYQGQVATALAVSLLSSLLLFNAQAATAQTTSPPSATATRPATTLPRQTSIQNESPPATTTQTTGEASRDPMVKKMNEDEKQKVDTKGK